MISISVFRKRYYTSIKNGEFFEEPPTMDVLPGFSTIGEIDEKGFFRTTKISLYSDEIRIHYKKAVYEAAAKYFSATEEYLKGLATHIQDSFERDNPGVPYT